MTEYNTFTQHVDADTDKQPCDFVTCRAYSGCYGGESVNVADMIVTTVICPSRAPSLQRKQIIFVVDESGSMCDTVDAVRASLFAVRNSLLRETGTNLQGVDEIRRDAIFSQSCNACLITFSNEAKCRWESDLALDLQKKEKGTTSFSRAVSEISPDSSTNIGDALKMAFEKKSLECATWIILLTDGVSNKGPCQTVEGYRSLMSELPMNTKIVPLGYTSEFDPDTLSVMGTMTYIDSEESISEILGGIVGEIVSCYGFNAHIVLPTINDKVIHPEEIITVPSVIPAKPLDIIGTKIIGCLFNERKFIYGRLPWGNMQRDELSAYVGLKGHVSYFDISDMSQVTIPFTITQGGNTIPDHICENYFASSKGRILLRLHQARKRRAFNQKYIDQILEKIRTWKHAEATNHKEEIMRIINELDRGQVEAATLVTAASASLAQTSYNVTGRHTTNTQRNTCTLSSRDAGEYSQNFGSQPQVVIDLELASPTNPVRTTLPMYT